LFQLRHCIGLLLLSQAGQAAALLRDNAPAFWIRAAGEVELTARREFTARSQFLTEFEGNAAPATLELRSLGHLRVLLDERVIFEQLLAQAEREQAASVALPALSGRHGLRIDVANPHGPAALWARCDALELASSRRWQARAQIEGREFAPALHLLEHRPPQIALEMPSAWQALARSGFYFLGLWALAWLLLRWVPEPFTPEHVRFALLALFAFLAVWNLPRLPAELGFDAPFHLEYVGFLHRMGRLPLASDGWQMFQPPLYYVVAAACYRLLEASMETVTALRGLRAISLLCGLIQIELVFRALRSRLGDRPQLVVAGTLFAGFLPINLYMSQWVGNEPLAGVFGSAVLVFCLSRVRSPLPRRTAIWLGVLLGLAILSKVSALMLVPVALSFVFWRTRRIAAAAWALAACALVCGWYFARNWIGLGQPLVLSSSDVDWWQAPGYRSWQHLWHFGVSWTRPVMAGLNSFGDAVYSTLWLDGQLSSAAGHAVLPPWRYDFLLACAPLAIVPSLLLVIGFCAAWLRREAQRVLLATAVVIYFAALLQQYMALPIFSTGKASYTLALLPAYGILAITAVDVVGRRLPRLAPALAAYLCAFAVFAYWSYLAA
jgi:hypothetical protein